MTEEVSAVKLLFKALVSFPLYFLGWVLGLALAVLTDLHITSLAVAAVTLGFATSSVLTGVAAFFVVYAVSRIVSNVADAIAFGSGRLARGIENSGNAISYTLNEQQPDVVQVEGVSDESS